MYIYIYHIHVQYVYIQIYSYMYIHITHIFTEAGLRWRTMHTASSAAACLRPPPAIGLSTNCVAQGYLTYKKTHPLGTLP